MAGIVAVHAYFVATEYALVTVRRTRISQLAADGNRPAALVQDTLSRLPELIAAVQLGVTMASLALGALAEPTVATVLEPAFGFVSSSWKPVTAHGVAVTLTFVLITAVDIVIAELVPKTVALRDSDRLALAVIRPIRLFIVVFRPFIEILNLAGSLVIRILGLAPDHDGTQAHSTEELRMLVAASTRAGVLDAEEQEMLERVLEFSRLTARQVMVPRTEVIAIEVSSDRAAVETVVRASRHTRYPVYEENLDHIVGILYVRDLLYGAQPPGAGGFDLRRLLRQPLFVPDSKTIDALLAEMRHSRIHVGVVLDEFSGTAGIVTLEDILERIVGELRDEFELQREEVEELPHGDAVVDGLMLVADLNDRFDLHLDEDQADTVGGLVLSLLGRVAEVGDSVESNGCRLTVIEMDGRRVARVRMTRTEPRPVQA